MAMLPQRHIPPQTEVAHLRFSPDTCYQLAYTTLAGMPAQMLASDPSVRHLSGVMKGAVLMNVRIDGEPSGCAVTVQGSILPNKLTIGELTEVREYVAKLKGS
jgi:hypothetical protein